MDREAWWATVHAVAKSRTRLKRLSTHIVKRSGEAEREGHADSTELRLGSWELLSVSPQRCPSH